MQMKNPNHPGELVRGCLGRTGCHRDRGSKGPRRDPLGSFEDHQRARLGVRGNSGAA